MRSYLIWGLVIAAGIAVVVFVLVPAFQPSTGEDVPVMSSSSHVEEGSDPGPYNSDPPTSGLHYANELPVGFYDEDEIAQFGLYPEGYLVHNLEHGYVIFWYNCNSLDQSSCTELKDDMREVMQDAGNFKVIAFPWSTDAQVIMTSWGKMLEFDTFDPGLARSFVRNNRNKAPEPFAP
jgi:hypothetical protein